jgi:hypothetical protein
VTPGQEIIEDMDLSGFRLHLLKGLCFDIMGEGRA